MDKISELLIKEAFLEDIPNKDITTDFLGVENHQGQAFLIAKQDLVMSGSELFEASFKYLDNNITLDWQYKDGDIITNKSKVCVLNGNLVNILKAERTALNFLGKLSGISTLTKDFVEATGDSKTKILDTRKTQPMYRVLNKKAVKDGGAVNHRMNLSDKTMIKDNHISLCGTLEKTVEALRENHQKINGKAPWIELEVKDIAEVKKAIHLKVDRVMLDNFNNDELKEALKIIPDTIETEASGNMSLERIQQIKDYGLDYISVGALTHSAICADFSLLFEF